MKSNDAYREAARHSHEIEADLREAPRHIAGIRCDVTSCVYHDGERFCCAEGITVGHAYAQNAQETACATYQPRFEG